MSSAPTRSIPPTRTEQQVLDLAAAGFRVAEIARGAGVSQPFVRKVLGPSHKGTRGRPSRAGPLSPLHRALGLRVAGFFVSFPGDPSLEDRATHFGWSVRKQGRIERGTWDVTLQDLKILAERMRTTVSRLLGEQT